MTISRSESSAISSITLSWSGSGSRKTVCSVVTTGIFRRAQQMQNMASGGTAEDSILVLQAHHVDIVEVQKLSRFFIRRQSSWASDHSRARDSHIPVRCHSLAAPAIELCHTLPRWRRKGRW